MGINTGLPLRAFPLLGLWGLRDFSSGLALSFAVLPGSSFLILCSYDLN